MIPTQSCQTRSSSVIALILQRVSPYSFQTRSHKPMALVPISNFFLQRKDLWWARQAGTVGPWWPSSMAANPMEVYTNYFGMKIKNSTTNKSTIFGILFQLTLEARSLSFVWNCRRETSGQGWCRPQMEREWWWRLGIRMVISSKAKLLGKYWRTIELIVHKQVNHYTIFIINN